MKMFIYLFKYFIIMITGELIKYIGITSIYQLPQFILIPYNFLAIMFSITNYTDKTITNKYSIKEIIIIIILTTLLDLTLIYFSNPNYSSYIIIIISNIIESLIIIPKENNYK